MDKIKRLLVLFGFLVWSLFCFGVFHGAFVIKMIKYMLSILIGIYHG